MILGIVLGLLAALSQSFSYVFSRRFSVRNLPRTGAAKLLVIGHVIQGVVCLPLLWFMWPDGLPSAMRWAPAVIGVAVSYAVGQFGLFIALRWVDASRISPLLGVKIIFVTILSIVVLREPVGPLAWAAVGLTFIAATALNYTGGRLPMRVIFALLITCIGYALSDTHILIAIDRMPGVPRAEAGRFVWCITWVFIGSSSVLMLPWLGDRRVEVWKLAAPYAIAWLLGMFFLFWTFALVGMVGGNILQATRGMMSIGIGWLIARAGGHHLERHVSRDVFVRRLAAATLMTLAIGLWALSRDRAAEPASVPGEEPASTTANGPS